MAAAAVSLFLLAATQCAMASDRYNFNAGWLLSVGGQPDGASGKTDDSGWQKVTLPYAWNQSEAFSRVCSELSDTVMWYRKHFVLPRSARGKRVVVEFEGARFGARVFINGHELGWAENGVMAFGFDLTPYIKYKGDNVLAVYVDSDWKYRDHPKADGKGGGAEKSSTFQWNDKNFYCNYGGLNKNVWLHVMEPVYQTLPLYSNLGTTGVYVYGEQTDPSSRTWRVNCETQVVNSTGETQTVTHRVALFDKDGREVSRFEGERREVAPRDTVVMKASGEVAGIHQWSWGYGYLYTVKSFIEAVPAGRKRGKVTADVASIQTGFRTTAFGDGMVKLNGRALQLKGFAQRSTNEWPALGISVPAWMSDFSNAMVLGCNGNFFRWMHVTPSKQDICSLDRLGLLQAMPAGDAEKDVTGRRWQQRVELMRDAIIYNRNNPSVIFYEGGNNNISEEHMAELKAVRDRYDPHGGRAIGSRNMLDSKVAEYGGEMLYVNKSAGKPMVMMEYNRDEGIRRYWDRWSYPYHKEGEGPLYRGDRTVAYNHNQDGLAVENIVRWNEYWIARPGTGRRVNAGGAKIIFSDSNTHARGEKNYRTSGDVDAMRIPKDSWFCHQVMWDGWVDLDSCRTYIIGHWNYEPGTVKPVYVCSSADEVELFLNGRSLGRGERSQNFLFTFKDVAWEPGTLKAVAWKDGLKAGGAEVSTVGKPVALRLRWIETGTPAFRADGADVRIAEVEAVDREGRRHPLAHDMVHFDVSGEGTYIGGVSGVVSDEERKHNAEARPSGELGIVSEGGHSKDTNGIGSHDLMLEGGVIRVMVRSTTSPGAVRLTASSDAYPSQTIEVATAACPVSGGFYVDAAGQPVEADWANQLPLCLDRGETPVTPSYTQKYNTVDVARFESPSNAADLHRLNDDIENTTWKSDGRLDHAWFRVTLARPAEIAQVVLRMNNFRSTSYPLQIFAVTDDGKSQLVWEGYTQKCLGDNYLDIDKPVKAATYEIRMVGPATVKEAFGSMTELAAKSKVSTASGKSATLAISELSFNEKCGGR